MESRVTDESRWNAMGVDISNNYDSPNHLIAEILYYSKKWNDKYIKVLDEEKLEKCFAFLRGIICPDAPEGYVESVIAKINENIKVAEVRKTANRFKFAVGAATLEGVSSSPTMNQEAQEIFETLRQDGNKKQDALNMINYALANAHDKEDQTELLQLSYWFAQNGNR